MDLKQEIHVIIQSKHSFFRFSREKFEPGPGLNHGSPDSNLGPG